MLTRQRVLLFLLRESGRPVSRLELTKWCFLLRNETPSGGGATFYDFLPYHYGPFSYGLYREADALVEAGRINELDSKTWRIAESGKDEATRLNPSVAQDARDVIRRFAHERVESLVRYVYEKHQWYTVNARHNPLAKRPTANPAAYTIGYEGASIDGFLDALLRHGIGTIIDVRRHPVARRFGFHKSTLERLCRSVDIEYEHVPELGVPSERRQQLEGAEDYRALFDWYDRTVLPAETDAVHRISEKMTSGPSALVCMERDPLRCHRTRIAEAVAKASGLPVVHLKATA